MSNEVSQAIRILKRIFGSLVLRPLQRWNVQNRAIDLVEKTEKNGLPPVIPPVHNATKEYLEELLKHHPEIVDEVAKPPAQVIERSKQIKVNVEVVGAESNVQAETPQGSSRPLPVSTRKISFGLDAEPAIVPQGKVTISMATDIVRGHFAHPEDHPIEELADHYGLQVEDVEALVDYYKPFHVIHKQIEEKPILTGENIEKLLNGEMYRVKKAYMQIEREEWELKEGKTFIPDENLSNRLLKTPEYIPENVKWLQDEDERWGRKKNKESPAPPFREKLPEPQRDPQLEAQIGAAQIVAGSQVVNIQETPENKRIFERRLRQQAWQEQKLQKQIQEDDGPPPVKN